MLQSKRYFTFLIFILLSGYSHAQNNITGTWEGDLGRDQFLQLNIVQNGDRICGYSWDYVKTDQRSYCRAYFTGRYDKKKGKWLLEGTSFIENSGGHLLMRMSLGNHYTAGENILEGLSAIKSMFLTLLTGGAEDDVYLKKVAGRPQKMLDRMKDCFPEEKKPKDTAVTAPSKPSKPVESKAAVPPVAKAKDSTALPATTLPGADSTVIAAPVKTPAKDSISIPRLLSKRKNTEQSRIEVAVKNITLNVYDNAIVDGDTVSIFYNGKLLLSHQRLSEKPIVINLELDETQTRHEIVLFAENLGSIPPNTALIVVYAGKKRYELFSSASLEENAVLVFDYNPK